MVNGDVLFVNNAHMDFATSYWRPESDIHDARVYNYALDVSEIMELAERWPQEVCGNGVRQSGEQCDDGNIVAGDGCSPSCQIEVRYWFHASRSFVRTFTHTS
jgi:cysteine-rich repeat protein